MNGPAPAAMGRHMQGFSLLEVLVAMLVLAVGLLGLAALQTQALRFNNSAYARSQAVQLSYDMADRMRANLPALDPNNNNDYSDDSAYEQGAYDCNPANLPADPACIQTAPGGCTTAQMAQYDFRLWNQTVRDILPAGCGVVTHPTADLAQITVSWTEQVDEDGDGNPDVQSFVLRFEP